MQKTRVEIESFLEKNDVAQYIISNTTADNDKILQCLAYIDLNLITKAKELAEKQILLGNSGRFENEGKGVTMKVGEMQTVKWPVPNGDIYPPIH